MNFQTVTSLLITGWVLLLFTLVIQSGGVERAVYVVGIGIISTLSVINKNINNRKP